MAQEGDVVLITGKDDISQFFLFCTFYPQTPTSSTKTVKRAVRQRKSVWIKQTWRFLRQKKTSFFYKIGFLTLIFSVFCFEGIYQQTAIVKWVDSFVFTDTWKTLSSLNLSVRFFAFPINFSRFNVSLIMYSRANPIQANAAAHFGVYKNSFSSHAWGAQMLLFCRLLIDF